MTTMLGSGRGKYKAPRYDELADNEYLANHSVFTKPLESLEIVRQPYFSAATVLKGNAFEAEVIDHRRRYETRDVNEQNRTSQFACVELVGQNLESNAPIKERSAATNLISLLKKNPEEKINSDLSLNTIRTDDDNNDSIKITPKMLWKATEKSLFKNDDTDLMSLLEQLFIAKVQPFSSPIVTDFYAEKIFGE